MGEFHVFFFPFVAHGHMIPMLDIAKLFFSRGVSSTIFTTPLNKRYFADTISKMRKYHHGNKFEIQIIRFPAAEVGLPEDCETADKILSDELLPKFFLALSMLRDQVEQLLKEHKPSCLVADMFFPWATDVASKLNIPRLVFHGTSFFALSISHIIKSHKPQRSVLSDGEPFTLPSLPHEIKLTRMQLPEHERQDADMETEIGFAKMLEQVEESELTSSGAIVNSFYELEPDYADYYRDVMRRRAWHIGPISLCNREIEDKARRGKVATVEEYECLKWLDSKKPRSVIYVSFGTMAKFSHPQLHEIAMGLEDSGKNFIWVVRSEEDNGEDGKQWLPQGFEEKTRGRGMIVRGWAPQLLILDHEATGGFLTHCGWNSVLESVTAGVPMVTWPLFGEQFYNEKLVTQVLKVGFNIGGLQWNNRMEGVSVWGEEIANGVKRVMEGEEAEEMRNRLGRLKDTAKEAMEEGGSSYSDLNALLQELSSH